MQEFGKIQWNSIHAYVGRPQASRWSHVHPWTPPVNCQNGKAECSDTSLQFLANPPSWKILMSNVYFESYDDCVRKIGSIVKQASAFASSSSYVSGLTYLSWTPYNISIRIGDSSAKVQITMGTPLCRNPIWKHWLFHEPKNWSIRFLWDWWERVRLHRSSDSQQ